MYLLANPATDPTRWLLMSRCLPWMGRELLPAEGFANSAKKTMKTSLIRLPYRWCQGVYDKVSVGLSLMSGNDKVGMGISLVRPVGPDRGY